MLEVEVVEMLSARYGRSAAEPTRIHWAHHHIDSLGQVNALYAYLHPRTGEILLIGKAGRQNILNRLRCRSKDPFYEWAADQGINSFHLLVGTIDSPQYLTQELVYDLEAFLIHEIKPRGNVANVMSRGTSRPGLKVQCLGAWPHPRKTFVDGGFGTGVYQMGCSADVDEIFRRGLGF